MSAITPLPPAPPAPPVPVPASPRSPFLYLVTDPWIAFSWLVLIGPGLLAVLIQLQHPKPPSAFNIIASFLFTGYIFWSAYFGLAACWRFVIGRVSGIASMWMAVGCLSLVTLGWMFLAFAFLYAWLGGGIYQFGRRWWLLTHGQQPPFLTASRRVQYY